MVFGMVISAVVNDRLRPQSPSRMPLRAGCGKTQRRFESRGMDIQILLHNSDLTRYGVGQYKYLPFADNLRIKMCYWKKLYNRCAMFYFRPHRMYRWGSWSITAHTVSVIRVTIKSIYGSKISVFGLHIASLCVSITATNYLSTKCCTSS